MPARKQRKKPDELPSDAYHPKPEQTRLKIKFDICKDSIACFIGEKRNTFKQNSKGSGSLKKPNRIPSKSRPKKKE